MLAGSFIQAGPDTDLSWILFIGLGLLIFVVIIGALTSLKTYRPTPGIDSDARKSFKKAIRSSARKNLKK